MRAVVFLPPHLIVIKILCDKNCRSLGSWSTEWRRVADRRTVILIIHSVHWLAWIRVSEVIFFFTFSTGSDSFSAQQLYTCLRSCISYAMKTYCGAGVFFKYAAWFVPPLPRSHQTVWHCSALYRDVQKFDEQRLCYCWLFDWWCAGLLLVDRFVVLFLCWQVVPSTRNWWLAAVKSVALSWTNVQQRCAERCAHR